MQAEDRLEEATFFLEKIRRSKAEKEFRFFLHAFMNSSRSVTWVLQKEFAHTEGFEKWYEGKQKEMSRDPVMQLFLQKRNVAVKEHALESELHPSEILVPIRGKGRPLVRLKKFKPTNWFFYYIVGETAVFRNVVDLGEEYAEKLKILIEDFKIWKGDHVKPGSS